jgi:hypothetical protein
LIIVENLEGWSFRNIDSYNPELFFLKKSLGYTKEIIEELNIILNQLYQAKENKPNYEDGYEDGYKVGYDEAETEFKDRIT